MAWPERVAQTNAQQDPLRCKAHADMLTQSEFRWFVGVLVPLLLAILAAAWADAASRDRVDGVEVRVVSMENRVERLEGRVQKSLQALHEQQRSNHQELLRRLDAHPAP